MNKLKALNEKTDLNELEELRLKTIGKSGIISTLFSKMKIIEADKRKEFGQSINIVKNEIIDLLNQKKEEINQTIILNKINNESIDITLPGIKFNNGTAHPISIVTNEITELFKGMGYSIAEGEEVVLDKYNFEKANIPQDHPARDMQDTFYIDVEYLLRTHTTAIQTRVLENRANSLPIKVICPGKTYRRDDDDATHSHQFVQIEGLLVGENISLGDLKGTLQLLAKRMFGDSLQIRLRPSYFQFTEPSVEVDVTCFNCHGKGCNICKKTGWIEILGAGMVHPQVLEMAGIDSTKYSGFAFGLGVERIAMLKYGIDDIRSFYTNDKRFLSQFKRFN
ncbi:MAG: phenylalanine--tRNA ligase subunit alpha [Erysipelotrichaceae bacterium]